MDDGTIVGGRQGPNARVSRAVTRHHLPPDEKTPGLEQSPGVKCICVTCRGFPRKWRCRSVWVDLRLGTPSHMVLRRLRLALIWIKVSGWRASAAPVLGACRV